jgi:hypothetical protein
MKTISVSVSEDDYEAFRREARHQRRSIAQLIREAMATFRRDHMEQRSPLTDVPVLAGHRPLGAPASRIDIYDEVFDRG